jgi:cytidylate kinase
LRRLPDAVLVDTTDMAIDEAVSFVLENMRGAVPRKAD